MKPFIMKKYQTGFTLIELLAIVAIIAFLTAVVLFSIQSARLKSRDAKRVADINQIKAGLDLFATHCDSFPVAATPLVLTEGLSLYKGVNCNGGFGSSPAGEVMIGQLKSAPNPPDGSCTASQNDYTYTSADGSTFTLTFCLGAATGAYSVAGPQTILP